MVNFSLMFHHKYSLTELEGMMPWERDAYLLLIQDYIKAENDRIAAENNKNKR
jgi:hypothetical protein